MEAHIPRSCHRIRDVAECTRSQIFRPGFRASCKSRGDGPFSKAIFLLRLKAKTFARASALARPRHRGQPGCGCDNPRRNEARNCRVDRQGAAHPIDGDKNTAMRPASRVETGTRGVPCGASRPVQFGTAVCRDPPSIAARYPNCISSKGLQQIRQPQWDHRAGID